MFRSPSGLTQALPQQWEDGLPQRLVRMCPGLPSTEASGRLEQPLPKSFLWEDVKDQATYLNLGQL